MVTSGGYMDTIEIYHETSKILLDNTASYISVFMILEELHDEERRFTASRLNEIFNFSFESFSVQDLFRYNLRTLSPDADLSWIPDWRKDNEALLAST